MTQSEIQSEITRLESELKKVKESTVFNEQTLQSKIDAATATHSTHKTFFVGGAIEFATLLKEKFSEGWDFDDQCIPRTNFNAIGGGAHVCLKKSIELIADELAEIIKREDQLYREDLEGGFDQRIERAADLVEQIHRLKEKLKAEEKAESVREKARQQLRDELKAELSLQEGSA